MVALAAVAVVVVAALAALAVVVAAALAVLALVAEQFPRSPLFQPHLIVILVWRKLNKRSLDAPLVLFH